MIKHNDLPTMYSYVSYRSDTLSEPFGSILGTDGDVLDFGCDAFDDSGIDAISNA